MTTLPVADRWSESWRAIREATVPHWLEEAHEEAAEMWKEGWRPTYQGGMTWLVSPNERLWSPGSLFPSAYHYGVAVCERLVDILIAMYAGNRQQRRANRTLREKGGLSG